MVKKYMYNAFVEAIQWVGNYKEVKGFAKDNFYMTPNETFFIITPEGDVELQKGDYVVKSKEDSFWVYSEDDFRKIFKEI